MASKDKKRREESMQPHTRRPYLKAVFAGLLLTCAATMIVWSQTAASLLLSYLLAINVTAFCIMGYDKQAALKGAGRTPELVLGLWALLGGSLGCLLGMRCFKHKTQKARFQFIFAVALLCQALLITKFPLFSLDSRSSFRQQLSSDSADVREELYHD